MFALLVVNMLVSESCYSGNPLKMGGGGGGGTVCDSVPVLLGSVASSTEVFPSVFLAAGPVSMGLENLEA